MANGTKHGCLAGETLDDSPYSAPMPVIGLYIAGATVVCFIFMFCDIWVGWRQRKRWLPCKFFSLNALTLTLLSIVAKLPVDLTSPMPRAEDQLSKLTGTTMICVCFAFSMPSLGTMASSECFSNVTALTIFVVTVIVNISIQIKTGVIFTFVPEHITILVLMFLLLATVWCIALVVDSEKDIYLDRTKNILLTGKGTSMMHRLRLCYVYCYMSNPQLEISRSLYFPLVGLVSTVCTLLLSEAVIRALFFKEVRFCMGQSDYKWSMWVVLVSQIVTVILGFLGNLFRWATLAEHIEAAGFRNLTNQRGENRLRSCILGVGLIVVSLGLFVAIFFLLPVLMVVKCFVHEEHRHVEEVEEVKETENELKACNIYVKEKWLLTKGVEDMNKWIGTLKLISPSHLEQLFSRFHPSQDPFSNYIDRIRPTEGDEDIPVNYNLSCLSFIVLSKKAANALTVEDLNCLQGSFSEVFETICLIDIKTNVFSFMSKEKVTYARRIMEDGTVYEKILSTQELGDFLRKEERIIQKFIDVGMQSSDREDVYNHIQQLFVDMLKWFFIKLPKVILKHVIEGRPESYNDRVKFCIESILKLESLHNKIDWKFPAVIDTTELITSQNTIQLRPSP